MTSPIFERYHVLVVPGWQNSGPEHWQSRWQDAHPAWQRVQQADWLTPSRADWVATLDAAVRAADRPVLLVAHSLGCATTAHWAAQHPDSAARVAAAWLVAPADTERADAPPAAGRTEPGSSRSRSAADAGASAPRGAGGITTATRWTSTATGRRSPGSSRGSRPASLAGRRSRP